MRTQLLFIAILFFVGQKGLAQNYDIENIRAALLSPHNNQAYFFVGKDKVYQYDPKTKNRKIRNLGSDALRGIPKDIDAAYIDPNDKYAYVFRGNSFYKYDIANGKLLSQDVVGQKYFKGINGPIDGAIPNGTSGRIAFFKGNKVYIYNPKTLKTVYSGTIGANNVYKGVPSNIDGVIKWTNGKAYFFKGDYYYRYDFSKQRVDILKQVTGRVGFKNLFTGIDAAIHITNSKNEYVGAKGFRGQVYNESLNKPYLPFGSRSLYSVCSHREFKANRYGKRYSKEVPYEGVPPKLDAALEHPVNKKAYFLKDSKYYRYDPKSRKVDKVGTIGVDGWKGIPTNIDAAFGDDRTKTIYFFKADKAYCYDTNTRRVKTIKPINALFKGVPNFLDGVLSDGGTLVYFQKKGIEYGYDFRQKKVISKKSISKIAH